MKPGDVVGGKYRLVQEIGTGNMGAVWSANFLTLDKPVALKFVLNSTRDLRQRLLREAKACGALSHPNIVRLYDVGETAEGDPFLVLELLSGETLGEMIKAKRRISPSVAARIARDIAGALGAAHKAQFVHRDLKPANVFLHRGPEMSDGEFVVKVLDFGVSKDMASQDGLVTATGAAVGSPAYMSPEQVCVRKDVDHRTDIWSLGIVLYEMLTGVRPFEGAVDQVVRNILLAEIVPPSTRVRSLPPEFDDIVNRCLERDRGKRIARAEDLVRILSPLVETSRSSRVQVNVPAGSTEPGYDAPSAMFHVASEPDGLAVTRMSEPSRPSRTPVVGPVAEEVGRRKTPLPSMSEKPKFTTTGTELIPKSLAESVLSEKSDASPTGTAVLDPQAQVGDPFAALRQQRQQALAEYRQTLKLPEPVVQGGTMAISQDVLEKATLGVTMEETPAGRGVFPGTIVVGPGNAQNRSARGRRGGRVVFGAIAIGVIAALSLVGVLIASSLSDEKVETVEVPMTMTAQSLPAIPATTDPATEEPKSAEVPGTARHEQAIAAPTVKAPGEPKVAQRAPSCGTNCTRKRAGDGARPTKSSSNFVPATERASTSRPRLFN